MILFRPLVIQQTSARPAHCTVATLPLILLPMKLLFQETWSIKGKEG